MDGLKGECLADSARYKIEAVPAECEEIFRELSYCAFAPLFSDQELGQKLKEAKEEAAQAAFSAEGFINSAIDSRVFYAAPWKHDSGIYPALFQRQSLSEARAALAEMAKNFYAPQNSALFIAGAIKKEAALALAEKTFGQFAPEAAAAQTSAQDEAALENGGGKKFVLSDPELSPDMAQVVVQFTSLGMEEADIAALVLDASRSEFKAALASEAGLNIRGSDYINAGAAHKSALSRLIIQALLEKSGGEKRKSEAGQSAGDKNGDANFFENAELFEKILRQKIASFSSEEFEAAKKFLCADFERSASNPRDFMDLLSQFWAVDGRAKKSWEQSGQAGDAASLAERFLSRPQRLNEASYEETKFALENEEPYFFILLNSKSYSPLAFAFEKNGFQSVTAKNASWHSQEMYSRLKDGAASSDSTKENEETKNDFSEDFILSAKASAKSAKLSNGIGLYGKQNPQSGACSVSLYIKGGEAESAQTELGLEAVVAGALSRNARKAAVQKVQAGLMKSASVHCQTDDASSLVTVECLAGDETQALEALSEALLFSQIVPAEVDARLSARKSAQIIKSGAMARQLFCAGIKAFYKPGILRALYSDKQDILKKVPFTKILEAYARLLDAGRLEIIACGNFDFARLKEKAEPLFGGLEAAWKEKALLPEARGMTKSAQKVKIAHTFLTDVSADKAGPRPAVLVPTTDFADPAQYWFLAPDDESEAALFDALIAALHSALQENFAANNRWNKMTARIEEKSPLVSYGAITIFNVQFVSDADAAMQEALARLKEEIQGSPDALERIKILWTKSALGGADKNLEAARLLAKKLDRARALGKDFDMEAALARDYETVSKAGSKEFARVFEKYFGVYCKFYSADAKR